MSTHYLPEEETILLRIARDTLERITTGHDPAPLDLEALPPALREERACFVTLHTRLGELRGCTGTLVARQPLAQEVSHMTVQTAFHDPRFMPVQADEVSDLVIEISILTPPEPLVFERPEELPALLRPRVDGVVLIIGGRRATFLPQVWERVPDPDLFLDMLCQKMGLLPGAWRHPGVEAYSYHSIILEEKIPPHRN